MTPASFKTAHPIVRAVVQTVRLQEASDADRAPPRIVTDFGAYWHVLVSTWSQRHIGRHALHTERDAQIRPPRQEALRRDRHLDPRSTLSPRIVERSDGCAYIVFERPAPQPGSTE